MEYKSSEIKAGIFILFSIVAFVGFLVIILGLNNIQEKEIYRVRFNYVGGIEKGSTVRYAGMEVGQIVDIYLPKDDYPGVELKMEVLKDTPIHEDSHAFMTTIGLMGSFYIEITAGSPDSPLLPEGALVKSQNVTGFAQMSNSATKVTEELYILLQHMNEVMSMENRENLGKMLTAMTEISETANHEMQDMLASMRILSENMNKTVNTVNSLLAQNDSTIANSLKGVEALVENSTNTVNQLSTVLQEMEYNISNNQDNYSELMSSMNVLVRNLEEFSQKIKDQPWQMVRKEIPRERQLAE